MAQDKSDRVLSLVILFLLATTLFNTLRANRVEERTTSFRKQARYEFKIYKKTLAEQERINTVLTRELERLIEVQTGNSVGR